MQPTFEPGATVFHTRRDHVRLELVNGPEERWLTLMTDDRTGPGPGILLGLEYEQVLGLYHRLGDWLVQADGLTRGPSESGR